MYETEVYIIGAGTYGEVMLELAQTLQYKVKGFYDEDEKKLSKKINDITVLGKFSNLTSQDIYKKQFIVAIGNNSLRHSIMKKINQVGGITPTLIHPTCVISPSAKIGMGVYIQANAYIWTEVSIDDFCIISPHVVVAHHSKLGKACLVSIQSGIGASIVIEDEVFIGIGSSIVTGISIIGKNTVIGAGSVVLKDVEKNSVYAGVPARKLRDVK